MVNHSRLSRDEGCKQEWRLLCLRNSLTLLQCHSGGDGICGGRGAEHLVWGFGLGRSVGVCGLRRGWRTRGILPVNVECYVVIFKDSGDSGSEATVRIVRRQ